MESTDEYHTDTQMDCFVYLNRDSPEEDKIYVPSNPKIKQEKVETCGL